jgi:hypothetical protein
MEQMSGVCMKIEICRSISTSRTTMFSQGLGMPCPCPVTPYPDFMNMNLRFMNIKLDELVKSPKTVIPAKAGIHK